ANLLPLKGHAYLLEAVGRLHARGLGVTLDVVGDGPSRAALERQVQDSGLGDAVRFRGRVGHETVLRGLAGGSWGVLAIAGVTAGCLRVSTEFDVRSTTAALCARFSSAKLAFVTQLFPPETAAGARRTGALAHAIAAIAAVHVVSPRPSYPQPELYEWERDD